MANLVFMLSSLTIVGTAIAVSGALAPTQTPKTFGSVVQRPNTSNVWMLTNRKTDDVCIIYRTKKIASTTYLLDVDPACDRVFDGSDYASHWQEADNGHVTLSGANGYVFAEFSQNTNGELTTINPDANDILLTPNS